MICTLFLMLASAGFPADFPDWRDSLTLCAIDGCRPPRMEEDSLEVPLEKLPADSLGALSVMLHPVLDGLMWPIEHTVEPVLRWGMEPLRRPVLYADSTDVIDRGVDLVRLDQKGRVMLYPTMVMDGGEGSRLGFTGMHSDLFGPGSYLRVSGSLMINRDWYGSMNLQSSSWNSMSVRTRVWASRSGNMGIWVPEASALDQQAATGAAWVDRYGGQLMLPYVWGHTWIEPRFEAAHYSASSPIKKSGTLRDPERYSWFDHGDRGVSGDQINYVGGMSIGQSTQDMEGTPTKGGIRSLDFERDWVKGGGDFVMMRAKVSWYVLLGEEGYIYRKGDLDPYLHFSPRTLAKILDPHTLRSRLVQRRVLAFTMRTNWMEELEQTRDPASFYSFPTMGGDAPARAYSGGRLLDNGLVGATMEYRWPIWKYVDGSAFLECAWAGRKPWLPDPDRVAPGWGTGIRVRTPRQFLFRAQVAQGLSGMRVIVTVDPEF